MTILNVKYRVLNNKNDTVQGIDQGNIEEMVIEKIVQTMQRRSGLNAPNVTKMTVHKHSKQNTTHAEQDARDIEH